MTTIYPAYSLYGNYLDGYYVKNYQDFITDLIGEATEKLVVNLGITDGVTIINTLKGDFTGYNCAVVERDNGDRDLYKITDKQFVRKGVWVITMVLDAFSKYYSNILDSTILVERLGIQEFKTWNAMYFNDEGFTLSKVKTEQTQITFDGLNISNNQSLGGYLLYIQRGEAPNLIIGSVTTTAPYEADYEVENINDFILYNNRVLSKDIDITLKGDETGKDQTGHYIFYEWRTANKYALQIMVLSEDDLSSVQSWAIEWTIYNGHLYLTTDWEAHYTGNWVKSNFAGRGVFLGTGNFGSPEDMPNFNLSTYLTTIYQYAKDNWMTGLDYDTYKEYEGKIIKDRNTGSYYRINFGTQTSYTYEKRITDQATIDNIMQQTCYQYEDTGLLYQFKETTVQVGFSLLGKDETIDNQQAPIGARETIDEGYYCLWIPRCNNILGNWNETMTLSILNTLREKYGGENGYIMDIQETYFVPKEIQSYFSVNNGMIELNIKDDTNWWTIKDSNGYVWAGYWMDYADGYLTNNLTLSVKNYKLEQQDEYILRSPSGASSYSFNLAMNNGVNGFVLYYSLRPYKSMYQVQPYFNGYYGTNFLDTRGLVMTEDTSLTQRTDLYETYKRQNVNYINSFNSNQAYERSSLALQQDYEKEMMGLRATSNMLNGYLNGLGSGAQAENEYNNDYYVSAINSGIRGAQEVTNAAINTAIEYTQFKNYQQQQRQQLELKQAEAKKQWKLSLGNIQALPYNTDKLDSIFENNTHTFILEKYTPTDYEIEVYSKYLSLFGIKIGQPLDLSKYSFDYIEGTVVILNKEITNEEYQEINEELVSGRRLYTNGENE